MSPEEAGRQITDAAVVTREDISRAKSFVFQAENLATDALADQWLASQGAVASREIHLDSAVAVDEIALFSTSCRLRMALYQALWELVSCAELLPSGETAMWAAQATWRTRHGGGGIPLQRLSCPYPRSTQRTPLASQPVKDVDIFLKDFDSGLHAGVREAVKQSLACFRRGLYLPSIAMLAAGVEAAWSECGAAVATCLADAKLQSALLSPVSSVGKKITETRRALDTHQGKSVIAAAAISRSRIDDAELWTTVLRERRNALHWGKAKSFLADHNDAADLLLGAATHLATLEAIRKAC